MAAIYGDLGRDAAFLAAFGTALAEGWRNGSQACIARYLAV